MTHPIVGHRWTDYYNAVAGRPPRETLLVALAEFEMEQEPTSPRFAIDLGCGDGRDTIELLRRGWRVLGIDAEAQAIARLRNRSGIYHEQLETRIERFEQLTFPQNVDLVNASFCLQFCPPEDFPSLWQAIVMAIRPGGRFCGHLIGDRDSWASFPHLNHHRCDQVTDLLVPFVVEWLKEEEHPGKTALGTEKYWHLFHIVARKNS
ncbi:class I SAM-dependent methyltransferase [Thermocoleostomius sinensis]|uniref:Class I SAM-dependent methyltransferase n=1 Tax=Thermocoleostomius sinensis A174 TaxID=2016057 RepID=A0A9E8Z8H0_9CYAN|nr:class I SAM-dependent methyltransferase [Thermocoleostomius sinensis]WAL58434.1 class I SAM-dependent methyltransferase [Thermocoleostomius sinensis A174]